VLQLNGTEISKQQQYTESYTPINALPYAIKLVFVRAHARTHTHTHTPNVMLPHHHIDFLHF